MYSCQQLTGYIYQDVTNWKPYRLHVVKHVYNSASNHVANHQKYC